MDPDVQNTLIRYLIKIFVKYKLIVSARDVLNFVYEILVPLENISKNNLKQNITFIDNLLPNLLFNTEGRSNLLKLFKEFDPVLERNLYLDNFINLCAEKVNFKNLDTKLSIFIHEVTTCLSTDNLPKKNRIMDPTTTRLSCLVRTQGRP